MKFYLFIIILFMPVLTYAEDANEIDYIREVDDEHYRKNSARLHKAEGVHQCQSDQSIGHSCKNIGINFTDCNHAFFKLKADDCCSGSEYGGRSINFKVVKCSPIY